MKSVNLPALLAVSAIFLAPTLVPSNCSAQEQPTIAATEEAAHGAMLKGDYSSAEKLYRNAVEKEHASAELLTDLGVAVEMQGRTSEASQIFERALKQKFLPRTYALLAKQRCLSRDLEEARPMLNKILRDSIADAGILAIVAPCYLDLDEPVESVNAYTILQRDPSYPQDLALIQLAKSYLAASQFFVARLKQSSGSQPYIQALGEASRAGDPRSAFPLAQSASPNFHAGLGFEEVLATWRQHENDPALLYQLAVLSGEQSMQQIELCDRRYPDSPYLAQLQFEMLADQGREDEAVSGYEGLLHSHPELPDVRYDLGMLYRKQRQWDKALAVFRQQLDANPRDERAAARVSEALDQLTQWTALRDFLTPRVQQETPPLWATLDLAEALEQLGEARKAISILSHAEPQYPSSRAVHFRLLHLYRSTGDRQRADAEAQWFKSQPR
jgi:tetratricopeptide (TPR) repeat protein